MFHFPYRAPASFATCQSDSISSTFAMFRKVIFIKFFVPLQTLFLSLKIAIFCRIVPRSKSENPHASFSMCCARFFCYVSKRLDFFKLRSVAHNCSIRIRKSANVSYFYFNKRAIFYKVAPRNSLCR